MDGHINAISARISGYVLEAPTDAVDADRFEKLARAASVANTSAAVVELLGSALGLWRGPAFDEFSDPGIDFAHFFGDFAG